MKLAAKLFATALFLSPLAASAGVMYEWRSTNSEAPYGISLQLEFDAQAVQAGSLVFDVEPDYSGTPRYDSGLLSLVYSFPGAAPAISYRPREELLGYGWGYLNMNLTFGQDGSLSGYIYANNSESHFAMGSDGALFTLLDANSDMGMPGAGCGWTTETPCTGATGYFQRMTQTSPFIEVREVPEPASIALIGAGLFGVLAGRRRRVKHQA